MLDKKYFLISLLLLKYLILLNFTPNLEATRYISFFSQCRDFFSCLNPYDGIEFLDKSYLSFPYSNLMYFVLLPFYFIGNLFNISFVNLSYLVFELILIFTLKEIFKISDKNLYLILILNPLLIYSIGTLGQLDFIPLTFFMISLYFLKEKNKYYSIMFLVLSFSSKIIFIILLPIVLLYFLKFDETSSEVLNTLIYTIVLTTLFNLQFLIDLNYRETILYGINKGFSVVSDSSNILSNSLLFILVFLSFTIFMYWKNIHRLDFIGVCIFTGFMTFPIYITSLSNIGWLLWSFPAFLILFFSFEYKVKILIMSFFSLLVISNQENEYININESYMAIFDFLIYTTSIIILYYSIQILNKNIYFKIKSSPIIISIAGDSATGKTTFSNILEQFFGSKFVDKVELDSFHKYERNDPAWEANTHLNPRMNNLLEFKKTILSLINGETQIIQNYNHLTGKFDSTNKKRIKDFLIIEGLHSLYFNDLNKRFDLNVFFDVEEKIKDETKLNRDLDRKKTKREINKEIKKRKEDFSKYIVPQQTSSDINIKTILRDEDKVSFDIFLKSQYFFEFKILIDQIQDINIQEPNNDEDYINFKLDLSKNKSEEFFNTFAKGVHNLKSKKFNIDNLINHENAELVFKLAIILFLLNKKFENKL